MVPRCTLTGSPKYQSLSADASVLRGPSEILKVIFKTWWLKCRAISTTVHVVKQATEPKQRSRAWKPTPSGSSSSPWRRISDKTECKMHFGCHRPRELLLCSPLPSLSNNKSLDESRVVDENSLLLRSWVQSRKRVVKALKWRRRANDSRLKPAFSHL